MKWGTILKSATNMLAKMETFYDLDLARNVKLTIENAKGSTDKQIEYVREAFCPTGSSIEIGHELRKSSQIFVVSDIAKEHGFGIHLHNKLFLVYLPYTGTAYSVTSTYSATTGRSNVFTELSNPVYFVMLSTIVKATDVIDIPAETFKIVCSTKHPIETGYRVSYGGSDFAVADKDAFSEGCNVLLLAQETRVE